MLPYISAELDLSITMLDKKTRHINRLIRVADAVQSLRRDIDSYLKAYEKIGITKTREEAFFGEGFEESIVDTFMRLATARNRSRRSEEEIVVALLQRGVLEE